MWVFHWILIKCVPEEEKTIISFAQEVQLEHASLKALTSIAWQLRIKSYFVLRICPWHSYVYLEFCIALIHFKHQPSEFNIQTHHPMSSHRYVWFVPHRTQHSRKLHPSPWLQAQSVATHCHQISPATGCFGLFQKWPPLAEDIKNKNTIIKGGGLVNKKSTTWTKLMFRLRSTLWPCDRELKILVSLTWHPSLHPVSFEVDNTFASLTWNLLLVGDPIPSSICSIFVPYSPYGWWSTSCTSWYGI